MISHRIMDTNMIHEPKILKFVHKTDGSRIWYINTRLYKSFELHNEILEIKDEADNIMYISGKDWLLKDKISG